MEEYSSEDEELQQAIRESLAGPPQDFNRVQEGLLASCAEAKYAHARAMVEAQQTRWALQDQEEQQNLKRAIAASLEDTEAGAPASTTGAAGSAAGRGEGGYQGRGEGGAALKKRSKGEGGAALKNRGKGDGGADGSVRKIKGIASSEAECVITGDTVCMSDGRLETWPAPGERAAGELCSLCEDASVNKKLPCEHRLCQQCVITLFQKRKLLEGRENVSYATCPWCRDAWIMDDVKPC
jgi:hypothetical protein